MELEWLNAELVELVDGYTVDSDGPEPTNKLTTVLVAFQGGFVHIRDRGSSMRVQVVSAPAVRRVVYKKHFR
ncbi:MAG: hypothetical protein HOV87_31975 [Catenulispora sp.]|nr:hypothetical protein [Catenulispora sp.]